MTCLICGSLRDLVGCNTFRNRKHTNWQIPTSTTFKSTSRSKRAVWRWSRPLLRHSVNLTNESLSTWTRLPTLSECLLKFFAKDRLLSLNTSPRHTATLLCLFRTTGFVSILTKMDQSQSRTSERVWANFTSFWRATTISRRRPELKVRFTRRPKNT